MKLALYIRVFKTSHLPILEELCSIVKQKNISICIFHTVFEEMKAHCDLNDDVTTFKDHKTLPKDVDFLLSIGGDGTLLDTVQIVRDKGIPVAGINAGRLGFLADIDKQEIKELIFSLENNTFSLERRTLIHIDTNKPVFKEVSYGLNEFTIHKTDSSSMITILVYLNGEYLNSYWADGLIIATPTGSTAYSLSCGGPIVFPTTKSFVLTPVAPHNLNARPMVIPDDTVLSFEVISRSESYLCTLDSRSKAVDKTYQIAVRKEDFTFNLIRMPESHYLKTLRQKIKWGDDLRN
ncbi:MAG: NAD kinase [Bacteroidetes bacterium]|nr:NAD kinase [Bacteroidota bacterium]